MLFLFVSRKFSPKCSEGGFLEYCGFSATGNEKSESLEKNEHLQKLLNIIFGFSIVRRTFKKKIQTFNSKFKFTDGISICKNLSVFKSKIAQCGYMIESWFKCQSIENSKLNKRRGLWSS